MYAIVENGSKQYKAEVGSVIRFEKLSANVGDKVEFDVLMVSDENGIKVADEAKAFKAVGLNKGISAIEQNTFAGCCYLTSITIPEGVKAIRMGAFSGCPIKEMVMPSTLEWIEANIFGHYARYSEKPCYLEKLDLSKTKLTELPANAFSREKALRTVLLPDTLDSICSLAFEECTALETVNIPDSVIYIHPRAFYGCTSLKTTIPERNESF